MQQLTKSLGSLSWALPLFGLQQMTNAVRRSEDGTLGGDAIAAFEAVTRTSLDQVGTSVRETFETGDKIQRDIMDMVFRIVPIGGSEKQGVTVPGTSAIADVLNPIQMMNRFTGRGQDAAVPPPAPAAPPAPQPAVAELGWGPVPLAD